MNLWNDVWTTVVLEWMSKMKRERKKNKWMAGASLIITKYFAIAKNIFEIEKERWHWVNAPIEIDFSHEMLTSYLLFSLNVIGFLFSEFN